MGRSKVKSQASESSGYGLEQQKSQGNHVTFHWKPLFPQIPLPLGQQIPRKNPPGARPFVQAETSGFCVIPYEIGKLRNMQQLDFSRNKLSGPIPSSISSLTQMYRLSLGENNLTSSLPSGPWYCVGLRAQFQIPLFSRPWLVCMSKCSELKDAHTLLDAMSEPDVVYWSALVSGCRKAFDDMDALDIGTCSAFVSGLLRNGFVDEAWMGTTLVSASSATMVEGIAALETLRWAHSKNCRRVHILTDASEVVSGIKDVPRKTLVEAQNIAKGT
ncbi:hypothetical protein RHSIM_Rhsim09G0175200 [Rhododendron simsii]|uniref:Uncharacterized protein n=1 Tax=Rhododendron simsii TaxID=118357 RepID=A0A834GIF0_RHOSS|nr:hypothetical protein RHSIM_Rhsim09G0175200 [Rhododendron simsii]